MAPGLMTLTLAFGNYGLAGTHAGNQRQFDACRSHAPRCALNLRRYSFKTGAIMIRVGFEGI